MISTIIVVMYHYNLYNIINILIKINFTIDLSRSSPKYIFPNFIK